MIQESLFACESVDLFAGGGGASLGILRATGRAPSVAINHDPAAIQMHAANHPGTLHLCESVFAVAPFLPRGRSIDLLWLSPDCTHHSRAKGGKPLSNDRRGLAGIGVVWARAVRPRVIALENVPEWLAWGPLHPDDHPDEGLRGRPIAERAGESFRAWAGELEALGYHVEWRCLVAADYGAPTTRRRLFLIARCDGRPIVWPEPTHGAGRAQPWRTAAECIDWSIPCPSIFERARPLAEATQRRIAEGLRRYVLTAARPFIVTTGHQSSDGGKVRPVEAPLSTIVTKAEHLLVAPHLTKFYGSSRAGVGLDQPTPTVTAGGGRGGGHAGLVAAWLAKHYGGVVGHEVERPLGTVTAQDHHSLAAAALAPCGQPGDNAAKVAAFVLKYYGAGVGQHQAASEPMHTIVTKARFGLVTVDLEGVPYTVVDIGMRMLQPRELARAQGFGDDYLLTGTKTEQIARIGNSAPPHVVEAIVRAQFGGRGDPVAVGMVA